MWVFWLVVSGEHDTVETMPSTNGQSDPPRPPDLTEFRRSWEAWLEYLQAEMSRTQEVLESLPKDGASSPSLPTRWQQKKMAKANVKAEKKRRAAPRRRGSQGETRGQQIDSVLGDGAWWTVGTLVAALASRGTPAGATERVADSAVRTVLIRSGQEYGWVSRKRRGKRSWHKAPGEAERIAP